MSFVGSVSWNFLKSFVKAAGTVVALALVPEIAIGLLLLGGAKYAGCAIITYFPEDLFDSDLWHKIYNNADKEMSELAEVSRVALERGPLGLIGYLGQGYADKVQTPEGIASTTGGICGTVAGTLGVKNLLSPEGQAGTSDVDDVEAGGIGDTEVGGVGDVESGNVGDVESGEIGDTTPGNISDTEAGKITDIEAGSGDTNITINDGGSDTKPRQLHHFATNKNKTYTPQFEEIANKYGLDLDDSWNKEYMPHQGRHPNEYHEYVLENMKQFDIIAQGDKNVFLQLYEKMKVHITDHPEMLNKDYWRNGEH